MTDHAHPHEHAPDRPDTPATHWQLMEAALRELLIEKGLFTAAEVMREVERMEGRSPHNGARIVARAWTDPAFRDWLLSDAGAAIRSLGIEPGPITLMVMADTPSLHNVIVCTLCSCYPRVLLGLPPAWYKSFAYRARVVREPRAVLAEFGTHLGEDIELVVHDSTAELRYIVLPQRPPGTDGWSEEQLAGLVGRDVLVGTALPVAA